MYILRLGDPVSVRHDTHRVLFIYWTLLFFYPLKLLWGSLLLWNLIEHAQIKRIVLQVPAVFTELGKSSFSHCAPATRNNMQNSLWVVSVLSSRQFKFLISSCLTSSCSSISSFIHFSF